MGSKQANPIKATRKKAGLTQAQAAELAGWKQSTWSQIETRDSLDNVELGTLKKVAKALGCEVSELISDGN